MWLIWFEPEFEIDATPGMDPDCKPVLEPQVEGCLDL